MFRRIQDFFFDIWFYAKWRNIAERNAHRIVANIEWLRAEEGDSVTILCDNPDGPDAVEVCGAWTNWDCRRYSGKDWIEALDNATEARQAYKRARDDKRN